MTDRHKVFVSFHHANDEDRKKIFDLRFGNNFGILVRGSVEIGDIDPQSNQEYVRQKIRDEYLSDSSVTVVLVGLQTWQRKHVDWEIYASLRDTTFNRRSGLIGILLPTFQKLYGGVQHWPSNKYTIPPRLADNIDNGFATLHDWSEDPVAVQGWIHRAYQRRTVIIPHNSRVMFARNRTDPKWTP